MNLFKKIFNNLLPPLVLLLLVFIPLYPKLPLVDIQNTWVYIRVEDFLVFTVLGIWFFMLLKKRVTLKTPLTIPIFLYWIIGALATIHGVIIIFPTIANVFPNVALLAYIRHIEYLSLFFVAFSAVKSKRFVKIVIWTVIAVLFAVIAYGFGQKYLSFPAFLTMNEEYAKGIPIIISPLNRVASTFAGHYDLAAYLVLVIPIAVSLFFGFKNYALKAVLAIAAILGTVLMLMTVSRVSFFVLFISLLFVIFLQKWKLLLYIFPLIIVAGIAFFYTQSSLLSRFGSTVKEIDVLVDAKSGSPIGQVKFHPRSYLYDKFVVHEEMEKGTLKPLTLQEINNARFEGVPLWLATYRLEKEVGVVEAEISSTGETLPQGSSYINLPLSPVVKRLTNFLYEYPIKEATSAATLKIVPGEYLVKRASAYDLSFTTRFQGEWPNALLAFSRNIFFGSGYGSVSLAVDNNYYRMLGETGVLGTLSFITIFIVLGVYLKKALPEVNSSATRSFILGFVAGVIGLALNAVLIDVFEASKVAFQLWLTAGIVVGAVSLYATKHFNVYRELLKSLTSPLALAIYLVLLTIIIFSPSLSNYFIGDDFTWFRWASECSNASNCKYNLSTVFNYFFNSEGFFYRPGTKTYFYLMYPVFWLNQIIYHSVSLALHLIVTILLFLVARKVLRSHLLAAIASLVFILSSGYLEMVFWVAATGHLLNALFILTSLLLFIKWFDGRKLIFLILSLVSSLAALTFHELGIITPFLMIAYSLFAGQNLSFNNLKRVFLNKIYVVIFLPNVIYLVIRFFSHTHWFNGDYSYNLVKFPMNALGNMIGYFLISLTGPLSYPIYEKLRMVSRDNILLSIVIFLPILILGFFAVKKLWNIFTKQELRIILFSLSFFVISLLPFLGLGNVTFRYSYLASFGLIMIAVLVTKKLYDYLLYFGKDIAILLIIMVFSVYSLFHIIQAQQSRIEWEGAGKKVENFLKSIDSLYSNFWANNKVDLYFIDVPIKNGNAWVFPVGLDDAVWFAFQNKNITVHTIPSTDSIPHEYYSSPSKWVFKFQPDGTLKRVIWTKKGPVEDEENN